MSCQLLHRLDPDRNMARFYRVEVLPDLFGMILVERRWGRIGGKGQSRTAAYPSVPLAEAAASGLIRAKQRRGYEQAASHHTAEHVTPVNRASRISPHPMTPDSSCLKDRATV